MHFTARYDEKNFMNVELVLTNDNGFSEKKTVGFSDFLDILNTANIQADHHLKPILIPEGFYSGAKSDDGSTFKAIIGLPACRRTLFYYGSVYDVPFPALVFYIAGNNGRINNTRVFSLDGPVHKSSLLYRYPFGNVYEDGAICWGGNTFRIVKDMKEGVEVVLSLFFSASTNDDLFFAPTGSRTQRELLETLKGKKVFPKKYLMKHRIGMQEIQNW